MPYGYGHSITHIHDPSPFDAEQLLIKIINEFQSIQGGFDISTLSFVQSKSLSAQDSILRGLYFRADGLRAFMVGSTNDKVYAYTLTSRFDVSTATFLNDFAVGQGELSPNAVFFKPDGTKMFVVGQTLDSVLEYNLGVAWDVTSATFLQSFNVSADESQPQGLWFRHDGLKMYVIGSVSDRVHEYNLSSAWNVSTASNVGSFLVSAEDGQPRGVAFSYGGTRMFVSGNNTSRIFEYHLDTPWVVSTSRLARSFLVSIQDLAPEDLTVNVEGDKLIVLGDQTKAFIEYNLKPEFARSRSMVRFPETLVQNTTATNQLQSSGASGALYGQLVTNLRGRRVLRINAIINIGTATVGTIKAVIRSGVVHNASVASTTLIATAGEIYDISSLPAGLSTLTFTFPTHVIPDEKTFIGVLIEGQNDFVGMRTQSNINLSLAKLGWFASAANATTFVISNPALDAGLQIFIEGESVEASELDPWTLKQLTLETTKNVGTEDSNPISVFFRPDGLKMYMVGSTNRRIYEYDLSTAWEVNTATLLQNLDVSPQDTAPRDVFFRDDGLKMYLLGLTNNRIYEYNLSVAWNITTALFSQQSSSFSSLDTTPNGIHFRSDGTTVYLVGSQQDRVYAIPISTPWNITTTGTAVQYMMPGNTDSSPWKVRFDNSGKFFYSMGSNNDTVAEYQLTTPWDLSTAAFVREFSVLAQDTIPLGLFFKADGAKMYMLGNTNKLVFQYRIATNPRRLGMSRQANEIENISEFRPGQRFRGSHTFGTSGVLTNPVVIALNGDWFVFQTSGGDILVHKSTDLGVTWTQVNSLVGEGLSTVATDLAPNGIIHLAFYSNASQLSYRTYDPVNNTFTGLESISTGLDNNVPFSIAVDSLNDPHVAYRLTNGIGYKDRVGGSWNSPITLTTNGSVGPIDIVIDQNDRSWIGGMRLTTQRISIWKSDARQATSFSVVVFSEPITFSTTGMHMAVTESGYIYGVRSSSAFGFNGIDGIAYWIHKDNSDMTNEANWNKQTINTNGKFARIFPYKEKVYILLGIGNGNSNPWFYENIFDGTFRAIGQISNAVVTLTTIFTRHNSLRTIAQRYIPVYYSFVQFQFDALGGTFKKLDMNRQRDETEDILETTPYLLELLRIVNEIVDIEEQAKNILGLIKAVNETENIEEFVQNILGEEIIKVLSETLEITEQINRRMALARTADEIVEISEDVARVKGLIQSVNEDVEILENVQRSLSLVREVSELVEITENTQRSLGLSRAVNEFVQIPEALARLLELSRVVDETVDITEQINRLQNLSRIANETIEILEFADNVTGQRQVINEDVNIDEQVNRLQSIVRAIQEQIEITENVQRNVSFVRIANEFQNILENIARRSSLSRVVDEIVQIPETIFRRSGLSRIVDEVVEISEFTRRILGFNKIANETVEIEENIQRRSILRRIANETVNIPEARNFARNMVRIIQEQQQILENTNFARNLARIIDETQQILETPIRYIFTLRFFINFSTKIVRQAEFTTRIRKVIDFVTRRRNDK